jgi:hypothetical protein
MFGVNCLFYIEDLPRQPALRSFQFPTNDSTTIVDARTYDWSTHFTVLRTDGHFAVTDVHIIKQQSDCRTVKIHKHTDKHYLYSFRVRSTLISWRLRAKNKTSSYPRTNDSNNHRRDPCYMNTSFVSNCLNGCFRSEVKCINGRGT